MSNLDLYNEAFKEALKIGDNLLGDGLVYEGVDEWDSLGHMSLVTNLEDAFDIMLETEDIVELNSYRKGFEILSKYDIEIDE